jgi:hypothetical protein
LKDAAINQSNKAPNKTETELTSSNSSTSFASDVQTQSKSLILNSKDLNLALSTDALTRKVKKGNKFTDGLELSTTSDWMNEIRPGKYAQRRCLCVNSIYANQ